MMIGLLLWRSFLAQLHTLLFKNITHGDVQFIYLMQDLKSNYLDFPSGSPSHVQGYILVNRHLIQDQ